MFLVLAEAIKLMKRRIDGHLLAMILNFAIAGTKVVFQALDSDIR